MGGTRIDSGSEAQLCDVMQTLKLCRVDDGPDTIRERNILFHRNANQSSASLQIGQLRDVVER